MKSNPLSGREFPRYSAVKTFFRMPIAHSLTEDFEVGIFGIPFDGGVSYRPGTRFGPGAVREQSALGRGFHLHRGFSVFERLAIMDLGDCSTVPIDLAQTYHKIEDFVGALLTNKKKFLAVGGDHSITLPILRALKKSTSEKINLIHFDAHLDTYPAAWNCEYHHGSFLRHVIEENLLTGGQVLQLGIRGPLTDAKDLLFSHKHQIRMVTVDDIRVQGLTNCLNSLPSFDEGLTYITYDIDVLDPAFAPGTGTPVPGGLSTYEVQKIFQALKIKNLVGGDVVEVSPPFDTAQITSLAAVDALFEMLALMANQNPG